MPTHVPHPTPYPDVNAVLQALLASVQAVLGDYFVGLYVHGSVASADFDPQRSDIDFLVVTTAELPGEMLPDLAAMHARLTASGLPLVAKLEGSYIPRPALRRYDPAQAQHPALRVDGSFAVDGHGSDWVIQRHIIREQGIVVAGPAPQTLIDPVQPDDLRRAVLGILQEWWSPPFPAPERFRRSEYQSYAVLTMCRALYTLQYGTVVPKPVAALWAQETLGEPLAALIAWALAWRPDAPTYHLHETLDFIRNTLARSQQFEIPAAPE